MNLILELNARFQPIHRFELEDALQEILEKNQLGEITGGGTAQNPDGEIMYCDIEIQLTNDKSEDVKWLAYYSNGVDLPTEVYQNCDINYVIEQMEQAMERIGRMYSYWEGSSYAALYFYGSSFAEMKKKLSHSLQNILYVRNAV